MPNVAPSVNTVWSPQVIAALIALLGVVIGLFVRDIFMAIHLTDQNRADDLQSKAATKAEQRFDLVRIYAEPLFDAASSLYFRLDEIVVKKQARYLQANVSPNPFLDYKKISTLYRIGVLLGWMRAIKLERGYLDPKKYESTKDEELINKIVEALADGYHIELRRLDELSRIWSVQNIKEENRVHLAYKIDGIRADYLASKQQLSAVDLASDQKTELANLCSNAIRQYENVDIPNALVEATSAQAAVTLGIKEAYIYRDWQAAIGDFMLKEISGGLRRYTVMGYGDFEDHYLQATKEETITRTKRWFNRLEAIVYDLDMERVGDFDARREQLLKLHDSCRNLKDSLDARIKNLEQLASQ